MVGGGTLVGRCGGAEGTMVGCEMGTCVLLEGDEELGPERFNGCMADGEDCSADGCETDIDVLFTGVAIVEFERLSAGTVDGGTSTVR
jgi:hypothetical protein